MCNWGQVFHPLGIHNLSSGSIRVQNFRSHPAPFQLLLMQALSSGE